MVIKVGQETQFEVPRFQNDFPTSRCGLCPCGLGRLDADVG
jgi:hypothetical protein